MAKNYSKFIYHFTWGTKNREPFIENNKELFLRTFFREKIPEKGGFFHAYDGIEDHIHLLCELPPTISVSDFIHKIKGSSSHAINEKFQNIIFRWQRGYGGFSVSKNELYKVKRYIEMQKEHHLDPLFDHEWETIDIGIEH